MVNRTKPQIEAENVKLRTLAGKLYAHLEAWDLEERVKLTRAEKDLLSDLAARYKEKFEV